MEEVTPKCPHREKINSYCSCPKEDCPRHGLCCECILDHKNRTDDPVLKRLPHCVREMVADAIDGKL